LFHKTVPPSRIGAGCNNVNENEQAFILIESIVSAIEDTTQLLWKFYESYSESYMCNYPLCNSPDMIKDVIGLTELYYNPHIFVHDVLNKPKTTTSRIATTITDRKVMTSTRKKPIDFRWNNGSLCSRTLYHINIEDIYDKGYKTKLKEKYRDVEREQINADVCLFTITIDTTDHSITIDFDGLNNDDQNTNHPSLVYDIQINLQSGSIQHKIIYICSFQLCNEKFFQSYLFLKLLYWRTDIDANLEFVNYFQTMLYDEADLVANCYDGKSKVTECKKGVCYATGNKYINSSFNAYCLIQNDLHQNYYVNITKKILPTSDKETIDNYQLTYTCNNNVNRVCNNFTFFEYIYQGVHVLYESVYGFTDISKENIFTDSNIETSIDSSNESFTDGYSIDTSMFTKNYLNVTSTVSEKISNQSNRNNQTSKLFLIFIMIYLFL
jgi:hypothetical protein